MLPQFGKNMAHWRKVQGISQKDLAKATGLSQRMISYYEKVSPNIPTVKVVKICDALKITPADLFEVDFSQAPKLSEWDTRLLKQLQLIKKLPLDDRRYVTKTINTVLERHSLKNPHWNAKAS